MRQSKAGDVLCTLLAGLETGVLGGMLVVAWYALGSLLGGEWIWAVPVRLAAAVYGPQLVPGETALSALAGVALLLASAGLIGVLFGIVLLFRWCQRRALLLGLFVGVGWYYFAYDVLLGRFGRGVRTVAPLRSILLAHVVYGLVLATHGRFLSSLRSGCQTEG